MLLAIPVGKVFICFHRSRDVSEATTNGKVKTMYLVKWRLSFATVDYQKGPMSLEEAKAEVIDARSQGVLAWTVKVEDVK
jgi:hypothetical protein